MDNCAKKNKKSGDRVKVTPETVFGGLDAYQKVIDAPASTSSSWPPPRASARTTWKRRSRPSKHVFCEKPVAVDARRHPQVPGAGGGGQEAGRVAIVAGTQRRHQKGYIETVKQIHDGAIGDITAARCSWNGGGIWFHAAQGGREGRRVPDPNWYHFLWLCGDHIVEQHVHNLDVINWVMNAHPVKAVAMGGRATRDAVIAAQLKKIPRFKDVPVGDPKEYGNIWDHYAVEYEYPNGVKLFSYCEHIAGSKSDVSEAVFGSKGACQVNRYAVGKKKIGEDNDVSAYVQEHVDLLRSIREGKPVNELQAVTESTFTAILGRDAAFSGKELTWDGLLKGGKSTMPANLALGMDIPVPAAAVPGQGKVM